jgi:hypothetical protein
MVRTIAVWVFGLLASAIVALALCFIVGYLLAGWWSRSRDTSPLVKICARVDYLNGLQESQDAPGDDVRTEVKALAEECRAALRDRAEENN